MGVEAISPAQFSIGPLTRAIDAADFTKWLAAAPAGARLPYAEGPVPPRGHPVWIAVSAAVKAGQVTTHQTRDGRGWIFLVVRTAPNLKRGDRAATSDQLVEGSEEYRLYALLCREAEAYRCCPSNSVLAISLDLQGAVRRGGQRGEAAERARYLMAKLARLGLIHIEAGSPTVRRIVTILSTGAKTRPGSIGKPQRIEVQHG